MRKELFEGLSEAQVKKAKQCKNAEELLSLAKAEGLELNDEQLKAISGGTCLNSTPECTRKCPKCGTEVEGKTYDTSSITKPHFEFKCPNCGHKWSIN